MRTAHGRVRRAVSAVAMGRAVVVVDETATQGYLMYAADAATPALLAFTVRHTSGYVRVALTAADCDRLDLPPVCRQQTSSPDAAAHRVAVDACDVGTGISAIDRARIFATLAAADATAAGIQFLPRTLPEALDALEKDAVIMDALGPVIGPAFLKVKRTELDAYNVEVHAWERRSYLQTL